VTGSYHRNKLNGVTIKATSAISGSQTLSSRRRDVT